MRTSFIKIYLASVLGVCSLAGIIFVKQNTINNVLISVFAGCFIETIVGVYEYTVIKRSELEKFLREVIHGANDFCANAYCISPNQRNELEIGMLIDNIVNMSPRCNTEVLQDVYNNAQFFWRNAAKRKLLYDIYYMHNSFQNNLYLLQVNLMRWRESKNKNIAIPVSYITDFYKQYVVIITDSHFARHFNSFKYLVDLQIDELQKVLYGEKHVDEQPKNTYKYLGNLNHLLSRNPQYVELISSRIKE